MKLRVRDNSLRLRLTRSEVESIHRDGLVSATLNFPGNAKIDYLLESSPACVAATAKYANNKISVQLPESEVSEWAISDNVAITAELPLDGPGTLKLLVEKDFACLSPREGEDDVDTFPHPREGTDSC